ncbi:MAG TPA: PSD1 and planctomycete cytochrome C domain-containing protein [Gemmataceae bacterium]|jgi:hypothetical protein
MHRNLCFRRLALLSLTIALLAVPAAAAEPKSNAPSAPIVFGRDVLPILSDNCFLCHGPDARKRKADLRLDTKEGALRRDDPVIVPGKSGDSELFRRIASDDPGEIMPPPKANRKLTAGQIALLKRWIDEGAKWGKHWAFEKPARPPLPAVNEKNWPRNPIDFFVLARLEAEGLKPSPPASKETLLRRVTLDLTGLPPTLAEMDAFRADNSPDAYEKVVDRLLASPRYGERMAWEWLDAARYADSNGYQGDAERTMWPWRDWVIEAINRNLPFDQFTVQQLAGDLLPNASREQKLATAFCRNHAINGEGGRIPEENRVDYVMDMMETTGTIWLGLTFNCCRCHDHKFDPLTQKDYYSLFAFFNQTPITGGGGNPQTPPVLELASREQTAELAKLTARVRDAARAVEEMEHKLDLSGDDLKAEVAAAFKAPAAKRNRGQIEKLERHWEATQPAYVALLKKQREAIDARDGFSRSFPRVMVMEDMPKPRDTFLLTRGSYEHPAEKVGMAVPASMPPLPHAAPKNRLALARWLVSSENPLTARVIVNRYWQQFFGVGLVKTSEDFGVRGERPSHPDLLDWLAMEFIHSGWDVKKLHRRIVTSATYRQSSRVPAALVERDPENRLLARGPRFRMPSWMIHDQALAASGLLVSKIGGAPVKSYQPAGVWEEATFGTKRYQRDKGAALYRRGVYTFWRRIVGPTMFFDSSARQTCVVKPTRTNTPLHALSTLNDVTYTEAARALAERVLTTAGPPEKRVELAFRLVLGREPSAEEQRVLLAGLERVRRQFAADPAAAKKLLSIGESKRDEALDVVAHAAYAAMCTAILNLDEALTKE